MGGPSEQIMLFGTAEPVRAPTAVVVGDLSFDVDAGAVRGLSWRGVELVRAIAWPIRDPDWVTLRPRILGETLDETVDGVRYLLDFDVAGGALACRVRVSAEAAGRLEAAIEMTAHADFATNRSGFTVLHPITGVAGSDLVVTHPDGSVERTRFPRLISPDQPVMDIAGLSHRVGQTDLDIRFSGEIFEMEDQRNWSDASYKTYCVPLVHPFTYTIAAGERRSQVITVTVSGGAGPAAGVDAPTALRFADAGERAPAVGLAVEERWVGGEEAFALATACGAGVLVVRTGTAPDEAWLDIVRRHVSASGAELDLEVVVGEGADVRAGLAALAERLADIGLAPARVLALPRAYLASHQPSGPWPPGPTPADAAAAARSAFPEARIGGGMLTNFTEFNRCRPDVRLCDYVSHGSTAVVHAADDRSVMETLEALPHIFESARAIAGALPYRLGLVSIGGRSNPYGSDVAPNPDQIRQTLAEVDPRQRGLFAAAFAVGVLAATGGQGVDAVCLAAPTGPFGIVHAPASWPQPGYDGGEDALVRPVYHVAKEAASMAGGSRLAFTGLPPAVRAYGTAGVTGARIMAANVGPEPVRIVLDRPAAVRILGTASFPDAVADPDWLRTAAAVEADAFDLGAYAVAFVRTGRETPG